jgi:hypothetical protein
MTASIDAGRTPRAVIVAFGVALCCATVGAIPAGERAAADFSRAALDRRAPVVAERSYTLNAGVRPLLFWIRRDNVGTARITWRASGSGHRVLEFLVGSDPARAPRSINRWGFIAEEVQPPDANLLGVMSKSDEQSPDEAQSQIAAEGQRDSHPYRAIRTTIRDRVASGGVVRVSSPKVLTYEDLDTLLGMIPGDVPTPHAVSLPKGTRPGFLFTVEELIASTLDRCRAGAHAQPASLPYLYNNTFYTLTLRSCDFESSRTVGDRVFANVIRGTFETRNARTGKETSFRLEYGTEGDLKAVPVRIVFRPKWWFEAELLLDDQPLGRSGVARP